MGQLKMAGFCSLLLLLSGLCIIIDARSAMRVDAENKSEPKILINLLKRILEIKRQQSQDKEIEPDVSPLTSRDNHMDDKGSDNNLETDVRDKDKDNNKENSSTLKEFDNCEEDAGSEDQRLMDSFKIENNGTSHGTKCKKVKPQDKIHDSLKLTPDQQNVMKRNFFKPFFPLWPKGIVQYVISNVFTKEEKEIMRKAFDEIENKTCIKLKPYNGKPVDPNMRSYIDIISAHGCWSYMGRLRRPKYHHQELSLERHVCVENMVIIHEVLHALGMVHEQSRQDRDKYLIMNFDNIENGEKNIDYIKFPTDDLNDFDLESVMMYPLSHYGKQQMKPKIEDLSFLAGSATGLEFYDVKDITVAYNCTAHCGKPPSCQYAGFINFKCECYCPSGIKGKTCTELETDKDCGGFIDVSNGPKTIQSPNYPQNYDVGKQCIWLVETQKGSHIRLSVDDMHLSYADKNCHHWMEVRYNMLGQTGRRICGNSQDTDVYETTPEGNPNMMMIIFNSKKVDEAKPSKGFKLTVSSFIVANPCIPNPCQNGGQCSASGSHFRCSCRSGWSGKTCQVVNPCDPNPCRNGGQCSGSGSKFSCSCSSKWTGSTCEVEDFCQSQPCLNGGTCTNAGSSFNCKCVSGWLGITCYYKDHCDFNSKKDETCFMQDTWQQWQPDNFRFKHVLSSDIRNDGYIYVNSTFSDYESAELFSYTTFKPGQHCFSYNYYQYAASGFIDDAAIFLSYDRNIIIDEWANKGKKWHSQKVSMTLKTQSTINLQVDTFLDAMVALDNIKLVEGAC